MIHKRSRLFAALGIGLAAALHCATAAAQSFPEGRITMVVGFGAGGMTDVTSRILAGKLEKLLGTTIVVENRAGAGGTLAIKSVSQMAADGHTLVSFLTDGPFTAAYQDRPIDLADWPIIGGCKAQGRGLVAAKGGPSSSSRERVADGANTTTAPLESGSVARGHGERAGAKQHNPQT